MRRIAPYPSSSSGASTSSCASSCEAQSASGNRELSTLTVDHRDFLEMHQRSGSMSSDEGSRRGSLYAASVSSSASSEASCPTPPPPISSPSIFCPGPYYSDESATDSDALTASADVSPALSPQTKPVSPSIFHEGMIAGDAARALKPPRAPAPPPESLADLPHAPKL